MSTHQTAEDAEKALQSLGLNILSEARISQWNADKDEAGMFEKDVELLGWVDDGTLLTKEFYIADPAGEDVGVYRKAWCGDYVGGTEPEIFLTDADHNEIETPTPGRDLRRSP